ncbi:MAG: D-alanyl-D-alanine carboxypeptidase family protein [Ruminococcus sp.]|uniref:D-alanyl-D-alanine carboxypeptidase family protein n=1 Tax=Ruminococcus sp. TaxID=41978 RepID=UPI001B73B6D2|nr:D-alanyl-D-alanine carboxypeptidase family protein [Ruminococcus sp.]MBP5581081.1 D-alanyl-D-alanine carboxypeptidase family protein [Ruminococcus sp.]
MDDNRYSSNRPRRKVSRRTYRNRRLAALAIIGFLVLLFVILIANACKDKGDKKSSSSGKNVTTITTTTTVTDPSITTTAPTTTAVTVPVNESDFRLDKQTVSIMVGEKDMPRVLEYPDGTLEADERWSTSDPSIAVVDSYGHITGVSPGVCLVTLKSAADPKQEVQIKVTVRGSASDNDSTTSPQSSRAEAPAPSVDDTEGLTYVNGVLLVNKEYGVPATYAPPLNSLCYEQFSLLTSAAAKEGLKIYICTGFRSYKDQEKIYEESVKTYGEAMADICTASPGHSEHQTGLCVDCNTADSSFGYTAEAAWLEQHAHEFGFIIRYPLGKEDITGRQYEPWHIRYVGSKIASRIHNSGICLEEYLGVA